MNAGRLLREAGYDSEALRTWIQPVDPDRVNVWPASSMFRKLWRPGIGGVTHWKWIFVDPRLMRGDRKQLARLVIHELVHVRQFEQLGYLTFLTRYIWDYLIGRWGGKDRRQAYMDIAAEAEARDMVSKIIDII